FRPDGKAFALGAKTGIVFYYELGTHTPKKFYCASDPKLGTRRPVVDLRFSSDGTRIIAHDEDLSTFVFDTKGSELPLPAPRKLIGVAGDGRTAVVPVQEVGPGATQTHEVKPDGTVEPRKVEYQIVEVGAQVLPAGPKMIVP